MCFGRETNNAPDVSLNSTNLAKRDSTRYLGFVIRNDLSDNDDILRQHKNLCVNANFLIHAFSKCSDHIKKKLFVAYCTPMYCMPLWFKTTKKIYSKLRVMYNSAFRRFFKLHYTDSISGSMVERSITTFEALHRKMVFSMLQRVNDSSNSIVSAISKRIQHGLSVAGTHWSTILY